MTDDQEADFITRLMAYWPGDWSADHVAAWFGAIGPIDDHHVADRALDFLRDTKSFRPSIAEFNEALAELRASDALYEERMGGNRTTVPLMDPDLNREWIERTRAIRGRARALGEHVHKDGATGCPVCQEHDHDRPNCPRCFYLMTGESA